MAIWWLLFWKQRWGQRMLKYWSTGYQLRGSQRKSKTRRRVVKRGKRFSLMPKLRVLLVTLVLFCAAWFMSQVDWSFDQAWMPINKVTVDGELRWLDRADLQERITQYSGVGLFALDVRSLRAELNQLQWVQRADVRRVLPETLHVEIIEQRPVARWNDNQLLGRDGKVFKPKNEQLLAFMQLPLLSGPSGRQRELHKQYRLYAEQLQPLGLQIAELHLDARRSWSLTLSDGVTVLLGNHEPEQRLQRMLLAYAAVLRSTWSNLNSLDLRYTHGFAVRWKPAV